MTGARAAIVAASALLALAVSGCASGGSGSAGTPQLSVTTTSLLTSHAASAPAVPVLPDAIGILRSGRGRVVESTETSKLDAAAAIRKGVLGETVDSTTTVVTATKARLTDAGARNRLVWVIGISPVLVPTHGLAPHMLLARRAVVIDANTGAWIEGADTSLRGGMR